MTWGFTDYIRDCGLRYTSKTQRQCAHWLSLFQAFCHERQVLQPDQLEPAHVLDFQTALRWQPNRLGRLYSPNTVDQAMLFVRAWCRWAAETQRLPANPAAQLVIRARPRVEGVVLSPEELQAVFDQPERATPCGLRDRCMLAVLASTNLGLVRTLALNLDSPLKLDPGLADELTAYLRHGRPRLLRDVAEPALFLAQGGHRLGLVRLRQVLLAAGAEAGLTVQLGFRILRRSYRAHRQRFRRRHGF